MKALYDAGIRPDMVVGSSAGAMNATFLAADPSEEGAARLCDIWRRVSNQDVVPGNVVNKALRLLRGKPSILPRNRSKHSSSRTSRLG